MVDVVCGSAEFGTTLVAMTFDEYMEAAMRVAGFSSNAALSRASGVATSSMSRWRNGVEQPSVEGLRRLANVLDVPIRHLIVAAGMMTWQEAGLPGPLTLPVPADIDALIAKVAESPMSDEAKQDVIAGLRRLAVPARASGKRERSDDGENTYGRSA